MRQRTILLIFGGCSNEHAVSLQSAQAVLEGMDRDRYSPLTVGITREGKWLYYHGPAGAVGDGSWERADCIPCALCPDRGRRQLLLLGEQVERLPFDAAFPVLHGKNGEDGTLQGLLELADIPIIGCGALSCALTMDKHRAHRLAAQAGIEVPAGCVFSRGAEEKAVRRAAETLGYPLYVKPVRSGSSLGISRVCAPSELAAAVEEALRHDREVLLEQEVSGFEVGCAVLGSGKLTVGAVDAIRLSGGFFDYEEKYTLRTSAVLCPAPIGTEKTLEVQEAARRIYRALDCRGFARVDFFLNDRGRLIFNEVNAIPGFTPHSRYPKMMACVGLTFPALIDRIIELGVRA